MKRCKSCNFANDDDAVFCESCGQKLVTVTDEQPEATAAPGVASLHFCAIPFPVERMRELAQSLFRKVIDPIRMSVAAAHSELKRDEDTANAVLKQAIAAADSELKKGKDSADAALKEAESRYDALRKEALDKLKEAQSRARSLQSQVGDRSNQANSHRKTLTGSSQEYVPKRHSRRLEPQPISLDSELVFRRHQPSSEILLVAERHAQAAKEMCDEFLKTKKPRVASTSPFMSATARKPGQATGRTR